MTFLRKPLASAVLATAMLLAPAPARAAETLTYSWPANAGPLDPHRYSPNQMFAQAMLYEPLVRYGADGAIHPWLAVSWTLSEDGRAYTFRLRDGVAFSDGSPFDAAAVKANFDAVLAERERHAWLELVARTERVEVVDPLTVRLVLRSPYYPALQELALIRPLRFMAPASLAGAARTPVGTGPWILAGTRRGEYDVFRRNEAYWGPKPAFDEVVVKVIADPNTRAIAFETGEIDLIHGAEGQISSSAFARFQAMGRYRTAVSAPLATRMAAINSNREPTSDLAVRRAINHAVDRDAISGKVLYGLEPRADTLFAPNLPYADLGLPPYAYDPALAARLLDEAGWKPDPASGVRARDGKRLRIEICFVGSDARQKAVAEVVQAELKEVGIEAVLIGEEESSISARQKNGGFGMILGTTWGAPYDPHAFLGAMRAPSHADYQAQLGLPMKAEIDRRIGEVLATTGEAERRGLYREILTALHEQAVYLPLTYLTAISLSRPDIEGVAFGATVDEIPFEAIRPAAR
jgi:nickel transport system substrate-binding protein